jgi:hypothetical protein
MRAASEDGERETKGGQNLHPPTMTGVDIRRITKGDRSRPATHSVYGTIT